MNHSEVTSNTDILDAMIFNTPEFQAALSKAPPEEREKIVKNLREFALDFYTKVVVPLKTASSST